MSAGRPLTDINVELQMDLLEEDRIALFEIMDLFKSDWIEEVAQLRTLSKRPPEPTPSPATVIPFRPEDRPDL